MLRVASVRQRSSSSSSKMRNTSACDALGRHATTSTSYGFRPRATLKRARWNMSDSETSSDSESDLSSEASSDDDRRASSDDDDDSTAATSDVDYHNSKSDSDEELSETESMRALDALDSDDEEWGFTPTKSGHRRRAYRATRRKRDVRSTAYCTPRKRRAVDSVDGTPTSVAITPKDKLRILGTVSHAPTALPARPRTLESLSQEELGKMSSRQRAKRLLHVGATPESLPCREEQFDEVAACLEDAVQEGLGGCVYVSGVPGTGKTATVREVIRSLQKDERMKPFNFVEINGMKLQDAHDAYSVLWHALTGVRSSNANALYRLSRHFGTRLHTKKTRDRYVQAAAAARKRKMANDRGSSDEEGGGGDDDEERATTVVLLDELDQMVTTRQDVMYNFFNWPNGPNSRLVVVAVANTMDLPERVLHAKVASRLGMTRITFKPYSDRQLCQIVHARLGIDEKLDNAAAAAAAHTLRGCQDVFAPEALVYLAKRISNVSGDARRMLDVCRRAIDAAEERTGGDDDEVSAITIGDMKRVLDAMVKSGKGAHITHLPTHAKVALVAVLLSVRRAGTAEVDLSTVTSVHINVCRMHNIPLPSHVGQASSGDMGRLSSMSYLLSRLCSMGLLIAVGSAVVSAKSGKYARYVLACSEDEARLALEQDSDERLRSLL